MVDEFNDNNPLYKQIQQIIRDYHAQVCKSDFIDRNDEVQNFT